MPRETTSPGKGTPLINRFNAGELSPRHDARADASRFAPYKSGCRTLENFIPLLQGGARRMPGTEYIASLKGSIIPVPAEPTATIPGFLPYDFARDDDYLYVAGVYCVYEDGAAHYYAEVRKFNWVTLEQVDKFSTTGVTLTNANNLMKGVCYDEGYLYAVGGIYGSGNNGYQESIIVKIDVSDMSEVWRKTYDHSADAYTYYDYGDGVCCDGTYVYWVGNHYDYYCNPPSDWTSKGFRQKHAISDGTLIWATDSVYSQYGHNLIEYGDYIGIPASYGGFRTIQRVHKTTNAMTLYGYGGGTGEGYFYPPREDIRNYYLHYSLFEYEDYWYVCGIGEYATSHSSIVGKFAPGDLLTEIARHEAHYHETASLYEWLVTVRANPSGVYCTGYKQKNMPGSPTYGYPTFFLKLDHGLNLDWVVYHEGYYIGTMHAFLLDLNRMWVGTYETDPSLNNWEREGYIERRSLDDGALLDELVIPGEWE